MIPELVPVQSNNIAAIGHANDTLYVQFKGKDNPVWRYANVPAHIHKEMLGSGSVGKYLQAFIKPNHPAERVS